MASALPLWFTQVFNFWNMFIAICFLIVLIVVILVKLGPPGRFFLDINLMPGPKKILLAKGHTNELKFYRVKEEGRSLKVKKDLYMFLPDFRREKANEKLSDEDMAFNEIIAEPSHIDGKIIYLGALSASVAVNPHLSDTIDKAKSGPDDVKAFFKDLETTFKGNFRRINILAPLSIQNIAQIMNRVITPQRLRAIFKEGELVGLNRHQTREGALYIVIAILVICILGLTWMVMKKMG